MLLCIQSCLCQVPVGLPVYFEVQCSVFLCESFLSLPNVSDAMIAIVLCEFVCFPLLCATSLIDIFVVIFPEHCFVSLNKSFCCPESCVLIPVSALGLAFPSQIDNLSLHLSQ